MRADIDQILKALKTVLPPSDRPIGLHEPEFGAAERAYVLDCIDSTFVSSVGKYVDRFEEMLAEFTGARRAVAVCNGTAALHVALEVAGVVRGDEVLVPALTFIATANAVSYCGARPHFVDSSGASLGLDPDKLDDGLARIAHMVNGACRNRETGARISAVVPMHTFGHPMAIDRLLGVAAKWNLAVVEDAAESLGSTYRGKHTGRFGAMGTLSFNGNKTITTGGGGAVITDDEALGKRLKHLTTTAKMPHAWAFGHDAVGYNYRMPNLNAALGCAQIEKLPAFLAEKRALAARYRSAFSQVPGVTFVSEPADSQSNYWLNALLLDEDSADLLQPLLERTNASGVGTRPVWTLMHHLPMYAACPRMDLSVAESLARRLVNIPSSPILGRS
ncbi:MAG: LegC family aminotransferase [Rhodospirillaceae bacterium]